MNPPLVAPSRPSVGYAQLWQFTSVINVLFNTCWDRTVGYGYQGGLVAPRGPLLGMFVMLFSQMHVTLLLKLYWKLFK